MKDYHELGDKLHRESIVIDGLTFLYTGPSTSLNPDLVTATNATVPETSDGFAETVGKVWRARKMIEDDPQGLLVRSVDDIRRAKRENKVGIMIGFQASLPLETDLDRVGIFRELGVTVIQLTYNFRTFAGDGCLEEADGGLSRFGKRLVRELGEVGIVLDLSHGGTRTTLDAIEVSDMPPIFSHANPLQVTDSKRNITDEQMKAVAEKGGVVGICTWGPICWKNKPQRPTTDDYVDHIEYAIDLVGIDSVSISTDSPCTDNEHLILEHSRVFNSTYPEVAIDFLSQVSRNQSDKYPVGIPGIQDLRAITGCLLDRGYSPTDIQKVLSGNLMRVFGKVWR